MKRWITVLIMVGLLLIIGTTAALAAPERPTVLISAFQTDPSPIIPGQEFTIRLKLDNVGDKDAKGVSITFNSSVQSNQNTSTLKAGDTATTTEGTEVFFPIGSGNVMYLDGIKKRQKAETTIRMIAPGELKPGVYKLNLSISYGDSSRLSYQMNQTIGLVAAQADTLKIVSLQYPSEMKPGEGGEISVELVNLGNAPLKGIYLSVNGDLKTEETSQYYGTFEAGDNDTFMTKFKADQAGTLKGEITVRYYDQFNIEKTVHQSLSICVKSSEAVLVKQASKGGIWESIVGFFKFILGIGDGK